MSSQNLVAFLRISLPPCIMTLREQRMEDGRFELAHLTQRVCSMGVSGLAKDAMWMSLAIPPEDEILNQKFAKSILLNFC